MVGGIRRSIFDITQVVVAALVRGSLRFLKEDARDAHVRTLMATLVGADKKTSFDTFIAQMSGDAWTLADRERFFVSSCELLDAKCLSDGAIHAFAKVSGAALHYSQEGEDIIVSRLIGDARKGFYVDVGAHHPTRFSNTYGLYRTGWRGINIDATPGSMAAFSALRPEDINLEAAVSDRTEPLTLHVFKEGALNTFDPKLSEAYTVDGWEMTDTIELQPLPLSELLDRYVAVGQAIDLLSVDVEGEDLAVLRSNNWGKYRPEVVIIEALNAPLLSLGADPAVAFLIERGYVPVSRLFNSVILRRAEQPNAKN